MAGLPPPPLKDWERPDKLNVELIGHGRQQKRVIVRLHLPKGRDRGPIQLTAALIIRDMKHSKGWKCEWCGAPARESHVQNLSFEQLDPPRLIIYLHFVCDMDERHVREGIKEVHDYMNMVNSAVWDRSRPCCPRGRGSRRTRSRVAATVANAMKPPGRTR